MLPTQALQFPQLDCLEKDNLITLHLKLQNCIAVMLLCVMYRQVLRIFHEVSTVHHLLINYLK